MLGSIDAILHVQWDDDLTITVCLEVVRRLEMLAQNSVVVNLAIDSQSNASFIVDQRLCASVDTHNTQALMAENCVVSNPVARPIGTTVSKAFDTLQCSGFEGGYRRMTADELVPVLLTASQRAPTYP